MTIVHELKRRNEFRVAIAYLIVAWLILQVGEVLQLICGQGSMRAGWEALTKTCRRRATP